MNVASYKAGKNCRWRFWGRVEEDGADCDLAECPAERLCDLTCQ